MEYECKCCEYRTTHGSNYKKHLETKKHKASTEKHVCKHCQKVFKFRQSMYHHMKHACKKNKEDEVKDEVKELVRLLKHDQEQMEELKKQLEHLSEKLEHNLKV